MSDPSEAPATPVTPSSRPASGRWQFRLWHALALLVAAAVALGAYKQLTRVVYPLADLEGAQELENFRGWRRVLTLGDRQGPYRYTSSLEFGKASVKTVHYQANGQQRTHKLVLPIRVLAAWFTNPQGNDAVLVFVRADNS